MNSATLYLSLVIALIEVNNMKPAVAARSSGPAHFKIGLLAPWNGTFEDFSALTSASAVSIAVERINADPTLADRINIT